MSPAKVSKRLFSQVGGIKSRHVSYGLRRIELMLRPAPGRIAASMHRAPLNSTKINADWAKRLKCNRAHPCDNCVKRGGVHGCTYANPVGRKKSVAGSPGVTSPDEMQNRIDRLESLVLSLMSNGAQSSGPSAAKKAIAQATSSSNSTAPASSISDGSQIGGHRPSVDYEAHDDDMIINEDDENDEEVATVAKSIGIMKVDGPKSMYISEAHWYSVLAEVSLFTPC
jgi:hypothetical protein